MCVSPYATRCSEARGMCYNCFMLSKNDIETLTIESISSDGAGVAHLSDGRAVFVPFTAAGDVARIKLVKLEKRYAFGRLEELITPSPDRVADSCPVYGRCGGCALRHISYEAELRSKRVFVADALARLGGIDAPVRETVPSPSPERCRNKAQYPIYQEGGELRFGFYSRRSHRAVEMSDCALEPREMTEATRAACEILTSLGASAYDERTRKGLARHLLVRRAESGAMLVCLVINARGFADEARFARELTQRMPQTETVVINENTDNTNVILGERFRTLAGEGFIEEELLGVPVRLYAPTFFQVNKGAAERLYERIAELAAPNEGDALLDLYCGAGTIGLSIALKHKLGALIGAETVAPAVEAAKLAASRLGLENCEFMLADSGEAAASLAAQGRKIDIAITDPPRKGCSTEALDALVSMSPRKIVMVSCNAATLARDLKYLEQHGYKTIEAVPVDMFPRTQHVETVALTVRV